MAAAHRERVLVIELFQQSTAMERSLEMRTARRSARGVVLAWLLTVAPGTTWAIAGDLDPTFGSGGIVTAGSGNQEHAYGLVLQPDGKLVAVGDTNLGGLYDFALRRFDSGGTLDPTFGSGGTVVSSIANDDGAYTVIIQPDGKLVVGGYSQYGPVGYTPREFALERYNTDGTSDSSFGTSGQVVTAIGILDDRVNALAIQDDGKLVAAGYVDRGGNDDVAIARYDPNGALDPSFGSGGIVTTAIDAAIGFRNEQAFALVIQPDGKVVVAGYSHSGINNDFLLIRYDSNGALDAGFGSGGIVVTPIASSHDVVYALALQPDGKLLAAGHAYSAVNKDFALARYNPDGTLDASFGAGGKIVTVIGPGDEEVRALVLQPDGKLVAAGQSYNGGKDNFALVRYGSDGALDSSFGEGGKVVTAIGIGHSYATSLVLQSDGKLVAAGYADSGGIGDMDFAVVRYLGDAVSTPTPTATSTPTPTGLCAATPLSGCRAPGRMSLRIRNHADDSRDKLSWKWTQGGETLMSALGDPRSTTDYALCIYDSGATPLVAAAAIAGGSSCGGVPCWIISGSTGFRYLDRLASHDGMLRLKLRSGAAGSAVVKVVGRGLALPDPVLPLTMPVTAQIRNGLGECWSSDFTAIPIRNDAELFKAKGP